MTSSSKTAGLAIATAFALAACGGTGNAPMRLPDATSNGLEIYVSTVDSIRLHWSPVPEQRYIEGTIRVTVDDQDPAPGDVTVALNGANVPLQDAGDGRWFDVKQAALAPPPPGSRLSVEARYRDGRTATFAFDCPTEVGVRATPTPIAAGAPVTVAWDGPIFLDAHPLSIAPMPWIAFCAYGGVGCGTYVELAPTDRSVTAAPPAWQAGPQGFLVELTVVGDVVQAVFPGPPLMFHQGHCILYQRTPFATVAPP